MRMIRVVWVPIFCAGLLACSDTESNSAPSDAGTTNDAGSTSDAGAAPTIELTTTLCDDPSALAALSATLGNGAGGVDNPTYGETNPAQLQRLLQTPTEGPFYMVNLIKFRDQAVYPDGRATTLTGREANDLYAPTEFIEAIGARVVFTGDVSGETLGAAGAWDQVAIVEYPCPVAFFAMSTDPEFQARSIHKEAGLEYSTVMVTYLQPVPEVEPVTPPFPSTSQDPSFEWIQVIRHRERAEYPAGSGEPDRTGAEAMAVYTSSVATVQERLGMTPTARLVVDGVFIGDGREWDEVWIDHVPSQATLDAFTSNATVASVERHFMAALDEGYGLKLATAFVDFSGGSENPATLPVTEAGTGTPCTTDSDCSGLEAALCLSDMGMGFCTVEGCGAGSCGDVYLCCRDCDPAAAADLPFEGSVCIPGELTGQLSTIAGCTCD